MKKYEKKPMKFALQMYTLRDSCKTGEELIAALRKVKEIGYDGVEFAGFCGLPAEKLKEELEKLGLVMVAGHESLDRLTSARKELIAYYRELGCGNIVCAGSPTKERSDLMRLETVLKEAGDDFSNAGIRLLYHNHSHEFLPAGGVRPIDLIKGYCQLELDSYWVFHSRNDVCGFLRENRERIGLVHLKDGDLNGTPCAVGEGRMDIQAVVDAAKEIGMEWLIVENDNPSPDGLSDALRSIQNLRKHQI